MAVAPAASPRVAVGAIETPPGDMATPTSSARIFVRRAVFSTYRLLRAPLPVGRSAREPATCACG